MNLGRFISNNKTNGNDVSFSGTATRFATLTIAVGIFVLVTSFAILNGFKSYIKGIVYEYSGHYEMSKIGGEKTMRVDSGLYLTYKDNFPEIKKIRAVTYLGCIIQNNETVQGIVIKGCDSIGIADMNANLIDGNGANTENTKKVLISENLSIKLSLGVGDKVIANFFGGNIKYRKLLIGGIFKTNLSDFDENMIVAPIGLLTKLNGWKPNEVASMEVVLHDEIDPDVFYEDFRYEVPFDLEVVSTRHKFLHLFAWLLNLDQNVMVLIVILFILVLFSIVSTMYIMVFEKNQMVGVLKSLGANNEQVLSVFRVIGLKIGIVGLVIGNCMALLFMFVQNKYKFLTLNPEHYYLSYIPVNVNFVNILAINLISIVVILFMLSIPYFVISKMRPVENLKFS